MASFWATEACLTETMSSQAATLSTPAFTSPPFPAIRAPFAIPVAAYPVKTRTKRLAHDTIYSNLTQLGADAAIPARPEDAVLERVANPQGGTRYTVRFTAPEFTSLCPMTGQPDFAHLVIDYIPGDWLVESKSLKLFLFSFRNHGAFHEDCTVTIGKRLVELLEPQWLRIGGYWYPRGGIPIDVFYQTGAAPADVWVPEQGVPTYRGRG